MTTLRLSPLALSRSRFALSPLAETVGTAIALARPHPDPWFASWRAHHLPDFTAALDADPFARGLIGLISSTKWLPGFVAVPPPDGMRTALTRELAALRAVSDDAFRAELAPSLTHSWRHHDLDWLTGRDWGPRTAALLDALWTAHIAPDWPRRRALLERDVAYRAGLLAAYGWPRALEQMSRHSTWVGADAIRFSNRPGAERVIGDDGMLFVPVSLSTGTWLCQGPPSHYAQVYPARGAATALTPGRSRHALARLVGTGRAALLHELAHPATSTEFAARLGQSLGTIGGHLSVLRDAGMVVGTRVGRRVVYRRTEDGDRLAGERDA